MTNGTANRFKLLVNEGSAEVRKPTCTVKLEDTVDNFNDFVAMGRNSGSNVLTIVVNTDVVTMGQALMLLTKKFEEAMMELKPEDQEAVLDILGG